MKTFSYLSIQRYARPKVEKKHELSIFDARMERLSINNEWSGKNWVWKVFKNKAKTQRSNTM